MVDRTYKDIKIPCPHHDQFFLTHGCSNIDCSKEIVFCSSCLIEQLEHVNTHKAYLCTLNQFIIEFSQNISNVKESLKPFQDIYSTKGDHLSYFQKFINDQKELVHNELRLVCESFYQHMERVKAMAFEEIDKLELNLKSHYDELAKHYETQEIAFLNFHQHWQLAQQLESLNPTQVSPFLKNVRSSIQALKNPDNSIIFQNLMRVTTMIQSFKKQSESTHLNLSQYSQKNMKVVQQEVQDKILGYINNIVKPIENAMSPRQKSRSNTKGVSSSPSYYGNQYTTFYENPAGPANGLKSSDIKNKSNIKKSSMAISKPLLPGVSKFSFEMEAVINADIPTSGLCTTGLSDYLFATGGKDCIVRIIRLMQPNGRNLT
jgi:hypothetical protein